MFHTRTARVIALGSLGALLLGAGVAVAGDGGRGEGRRHRRAREHGKMILERRGRALRTLHRLEGASDEQVKTALEASREVARFREEARTKAAAIVLHAFREGKDAAPEQRSGIREATRAKLRALREEYRAPLTEAGMKVVKTLTPEQRKKIEEAAKAKGLAVDDARLARWFGMRLAHPWAEALLKARLGER